MPLDLNKKHCHESLIVDNEIASHIVSAERWRKNTFCGVHKRHQCSNVFFVALIVKVHHTTLHAIMTKLSDAFYWVWVLFLVMGHILEGTADRIPFNPFYSLFRRIRLFSISRTFATCCVTGVRSDLLKGN